MNTTDIDTMTIDQLKADFMSIMSEVVIQYGDDDGRAQEQEQDQVSVQTMPIRS